MAHGAWIDRAEGRGDERGGAPGPEGGARVAARALLLGHDDRAEGCAQVRPRAAARVADGHVRPGERRRAPWQLTIKLVQVLA
eukprot:scaffold36071_cov32-Tisochrysis_lutea.AAC.1